MKGTLSSFKSNFPNPVLAGILVPTCLLLALSGCAKPDLHQSLRRFQSPQAVPMLLAAYQPWFGRPGHINVGYSSQDATVLEKQIAAAKNLGIDAFVVNWYGARKEYEDQSYALLQRVASQNKFLVALMYDEDTDDPGRSTDAVVVDLQYAYDRYISPHAELPRQAYLRYNGRPVIFIFPKGTNTDWKRIRKLANSWEDPPLLIMKHQGSEHEEAFDGSRYPDKIAVGAAWPGFDDSKAEWSQKRRISPRCGKTFEDSLRLFRRYYNENNPLPFLMIETWNDYEEGTAIERGLGRCSSPS